MPRKRANTTLSKNKAVVNKKVVNAKPLMQKEAGYFQELVDSSNRYTALAKQKAQYEFVLSKLQEKRNKVQSGEVKMPVVMALIPKVIYYQEYDKKEVLKLLDEQITSYKNNIMAIDGQLQHREEEYKESAVRTREFMTNRYGGLKAQTLGTTTHRKEIEDEDILFETEFKKLLENDETKEEFKKAQKEAVKKNVARQTKKAKK